jgi:cation transport regulator
MKPYRETEELPKSLRDELPELAQRMYLAVYQRVWETTAMGGETSEDELAETAHQAALLQVERRFEKDERGRWVQAAVDDEIGRDKLEGGTPDADEATH